MTMAEYVGVSIIILAALAPLLLVGLAAIGNNIGRASRGKYNPGSYSYSTPTFMGMSSNSEFTTVKALNLYHGTKLDYALEIHKTGAWLIGFSLPPAVWMTDNFDIAKTYAGPRGGIVQIEVDAGVELTKQATGVYIFKVPGAVAHGDYYRIEGITPIGVLNPQRNPIR